MTADDAHSNERFLLPGDPPLETVRLAGPPTHGRNHP
jgi:hypothetical protein